MCVCCALSVSVRLRGTGRDSVRRHKAHEARLRTFILGTTDKSPVNDSHAQISCPPEAAIKGLLVRRTPDDDTATIRTVPAPGHSAEQRQDQVAELERNFAEVDSIREPVSAEDTDQALPEAMHSVRLGYRPDR